MAGQLHLTLVQTDTVWHDPAANRRQITELLNTDHQTARADLIALPEMFTTGFTMDAVHQAETMAGESVSWMRNLAAEFDAVVTGTLVIRDGGSIFNRLLWILPDGRTEIYDKRHLFRMAGEDQEYSAGSGQAVFTLKDWRVRPIICYDLRFPVWCRARKNDYDLLLCLANWPSPRHQAWLALLVARAIENLVCVVAVNRVGTDGLGKTYLGSSLIIDAKGNTVADGGDTARLVHGSLELDKLRAFRRKFPVHLDADDFSLS